MTNRYPDPEAKELKKYGELFRHFLQKSSFRKRFRRTHLFPYHHFRRTCFYPVPTFSMYEIISQALGEKGIAVPLDRSFDLDLERVLRTIRSQNPKLIFLSSPNNPTGNCFSSEKL